MVLGLCFKYLGHWQSMKEKISSRFTFTFGSGLYYCTDIDRSIKTVFSKTICNDIIERRRAMFLIRSLIQDNSTK